MSSEAQLPGIGFIGLGAMGTPMATRIAQAGYPLTIFDVDTARTAQLAGALSCDQSKTPAEVAAASHLIVTMLPTSAIVADVLGGADGVLSALRPGTVIVEMSSGVPAMTRDLAARVAERDGTLVDAPVSGGTPRAKTGELAIMFGGDDAAFAIAEPVLKVMGTSLIRTGGVGTAHAMKALNNLVSAGGFLIGIEALLIGSKYGLDPAIMVDVLNASTGMNNSTQRKFKQFVLSRSFNAGFGLDLMVKDLSIALGVAADTATATPFAALCHAMWSGARSTLGPGLDHTAVARFSEMLAGAELSSSD